MLSGKYNFTCDQGATFRRTLRLKNKDSGALIDLTGYAAFMQIRRDIDDPDFLAELTTANGGITLGGTLGTAALYLSAATTATFPPEADYDLDLITPDGDRYTLLRGKFRTRKQVTR